MKILCSGLTSIAKNVLDKMSISKTNPDLDPEYLGYQRAVENKISKLAHTDAKSFFMLGEGIITLEGAIVSLVEKGERVLVIYNGFFGEGFADYVGYVGGEAVKFKGDFRRGINVADLKAFLEKDHDFAVATMVHCETPSGITNDVKSICELLHSYDIITVTDCVSSFAGEEIYFDEFNIDVMLSGSQKCISAPTGIGIVTLSKKAIDKINGRKTTVPSYYLNYKNYYAFNESCGFPYTQNENLIYAIDEALRNIPENYAFLHKKYAIATRNTLINCGFELFPKDSFSNTVTAVITPDGIKSEDILSQMRKQNIAISKGVGEYAEKIFRIGHMGHNINKANFIEMFEKLDTTFKNLGVKLNGSLKEEFEKEI